MRGTMFIASGCIFLALCGCGVNNVVSNTTGAKPVNQVNTTVSNKAPIHPSKYQPVPIPKLTTTKYQTNIPVVLLKEQVTSNKPVHPHPPKTVAVDLPPSLKGDFVAYFAYGATASPLLYIVLPKDMKPFGQNLVGENGSFDFTFIDSSGNTFGVGSDGMCDGCSASGGAPFFPAAEKDDVQSGGNPEPTLKEQGANVTYPKSDLALYAYSDKGIKTFGFNHYNIHVQNALGIDFSASYTGQNPDMKQIPWILKNLIEQNGEQTPVSTK